LLLANNIPFGVTRPSVVQIGLTADAAGLFLDFFNGAEDIAENFIPSELNRIPVIPDDFPLSTGMMPGDYLKIRARETSGVNRTLFISLISTPMR
jgi:hypothetical protein